MGSSTHENRFTATFSLPDMVLWNYLKGALE